MKFDNLPPFYSVSGHCHLKLVIEFQRFSDMELGTSHHTGPLAVWPTEYTLIY